MTGSRRGAGPSSGRDEIEAELAALRTDRAEITRALAGDDTALDAADQADRLERGADVSRLDARIDELVGFLEAPAARADDRLPDGTVVTVRSSDGATRTVRIVAIVDEIAPQDSSETVTADSPLGRALSGRGAGDDVTYSTPDGEESLRVLAVDLPPGSGTGDAERPRPSA